jgi:protein SCO1/2
MWRAAALVSVVLLAGGGIFWWATDGGRALTAEAARRLDIAAAPRPLPDVTLVDQTGATVALSAYRGAPLLMEFVYAGCADICVGLGRAFERLDAAVPPSVRLLSVSFDPADDVRRLGWFAERYGAVAPRWRVAGVPEAAARAALLAHAGVVALPDGMGGFVHNAGLYLVDRHGRLSAVFELEDTAAARAALDGHAR